MLTRLAKNRGQPPECLLAYRQRMGSLREIDRIQKYYFIIDL